MSARAGDRPALLAARTRLSLLAGGCAGLGAALYAAVYLSRPAALAPAAGPQAAAAPEALAALLVPLAIILPILATLAGTRAAPALEVDAGLALGWLNRLAYAAVTGAACGWAAWLLIIVVTPVVPGAAVGKPALVAAVGLGGGLLAAVTTFAAENAGPRGLLVRLGLLIGLGLLLAVLLTRDMRWWRDSLSYMGRAGAAGRVFAVTMILAGLGLCGAVLQMGAGLRCVAARGRFPPRRAATLTALLAAASLGVVTMGLFPSNDDPLSLALHRLLGNGGLAVFVGVMFALPWLAPPFGRTAHVASVTIGALNVCAFGLYRLNVLNFVWFELFNVALLMTWLLLFEAYYRSLLGEG